MSKTIISFQKLDNASKKASKIANKFNDYANALSNNVVSKLNQYSGEHNSHIQNALTDTNYKINELREKAINFANLSTSLSNVINDCTVCENNVMTLLFDYRDSFCEKYDMDINWSETPNVLDLLSGKTPDVRDPFSSYNNWKEDVENWWQFEGGKEYTLGTANIMLDGVISLVKLGAAVMSIATGSWFIAGIGLLLAIKSYSDVIFIQDENTKKAYLLSSDDPALARRTQRVKKIEDSMVFYSDDLKDYKSAKNIKNAEFGLSVIQFSYGLTNFSLDWYTKGLSGNPITNLMGSIKDSYFNFGMDKVLNTASGWLGIVSSTRDSFDGLGNYRVNKGAKEFVKNYLGKFFVAGSNDDYYDLSDFIELTTDAIDAAGNPPSMVDGGLIRNVDNNIDEYKNLRLG